jgi:hypothetical protein
LYDIANQNWNKMTAAAAAAGGLILGDRQASCWDFVVICDEYLATCGPARHLRVLRRIIELRFSFDVYLWMSLSSLIPAGSDNRETRKALPTFLFSAGWLSTNQQDDGWVAVSTRGHALCMG